jgi:two-component system LytT family response regulator
MSLLHLAIIDDERRVRNTLRHALEECGGVEIVAEADSLESARALLAAYPALDGIFLDIQLPGGTGFDLIPDIPDMRVVVFVTAYDQYAIRAFEVNALDYIMKPASAPRLEQSLRRLRAYKIERAHFAERTSADASSGDAGRADRTSRRETAIKPLSVEDQLLLRFNAKSRFVPVSDLVFVRSADNYTEVHIRDGSVSLMRRTLEEWAESLPASEFLRLHRSTLVNKRRISELHTDAKTGKYFIRLHEVNEEFPVSRSYVAAVREALR